MMPMDAVVCDVCEGIPAVGVASSVFGPASFAYCRECLATHREPYMMILYVLSTVTERDHLLPWALEIIDATLAFLQKTWDDALIEAHNDE
jgi:late competence protein required for DNA uptake (superfamily II DNA/RNA helicase)